MTESVGAECWPPAVDAADGPDGKEPLIAILYGWGPTARFPFEVKQEGQVFGNFWGKFPSIRILYIELVLKN